MGSGPALDSKAGDTLEGSTVQRRGLQGSRNQEEGIALYQVLTMGKCLCSLYYLLLAEEGRPLAQGHTALLNQG